MKWTKAKKYILGMHCHCPHRTFFSRPLRKDDYNVMCDETQNGAKTARMPQEKKILAIFTPMYLIVLEVRTPITKAIWAKKLKEIDLRSRPMSKHEKQ